MSCSRILPGLSSSQSTRNCPKLENAVDTAEKFRSTATSKSIAPHLNERWKWKYGADDGIHPSSQGAADGTTVPRDRQTLSFGVGMVNWGIGPHGPRVMSGGLKFSTTEPAKFPPEGSNRQCSSSLKTFPAPSARSNSKLSF